MWADTDRAATRAWNTVLDDLDLSDPELLYVFTSNALPWLYGEVTEFRPVRAEGCARCGCMHRQTGDLKRQSLIPLWEGLPHLRSALLERKYRVYVEFCGSCGLMEYEIVARTPPFRGPNRPSQHDESDQKRPQTAIRQAELPWDLRHVLGTRRNS